MEDGFDLDLLEGIDKSEILDETMDSLVVRYNETKNPDLLETIVIKSDPFVKWVVSNVANAVPSVLDREDLEQCGMLGLLSAIQRYDSTKGVSFFTWARNRIRGAALDQVRKASSTSRSRNVTWVDIGNVVESELDQRDVLLYQIEDILPQRASPVLRDALYMLPLQQSIVVLFNIHGLNIKQISYILAIGASEVTKQRDLAIQGLREYLVENLDDL